MNRTYKIALSGFLIAIGTLTGSIFYIPIGVVKAFPVQHLINVLSAILLGPVFALLNAFVIALFRNLMGTGSILAFPGSMVGALLAGLAFYKTKRKAYAFVGELIGTGVIGAGIAAAMAKLMLGSQAALSVFFTSFFLSSLVGVSLGLLLMKAIDFRFGGLIHENRSEHRRF